MVEKINALAESRVGGLDIDLMCQKNARDFVTETAEAIIGNDAVELISVNNFFGKTVFEVDGFKNFGQLKSHVLDHFTGSVGDVVAGHFKGR